MEAVEVIVGVGVIVGVRVTVGVSVEVGLAVAVGVVVDVDVTVAVAVAVGMRVAVGVAVGADKASHAVISKSKIKKKRRKLIVSISGEKSVIGYHEKTSRSMAYPQSRGHV